MATRFKPLIIPFSLAAACAAPAIASAKTVKNLTFDSHVAAQPTSAR